MVKSKSPGKEPEKDIEEKIVPSKSQEEETKVETQALLDLPEKLQGKSAEEVAKMYLELEKQYGKHSAEVSDARKYLQERELLAQAVARNPELYKMLENELSSLQRQPEATQEISRKDSGEAGKYGPQVIELRRAEENRIIGDFQRKFGIDKLPPEERDEAMKKVSTQFADLIDPGGNKPISQILSEVRIDQLSKHLENAYWLTKKESLMDRGKFSDQDFASIGSISASSSGKSEDNTLTERERSVAEKLGVSPDKYLKQKQQLSKQ